MATNRNKSTFKIAGGNDLDRNRQILEAWSLWPTLSFEEQLRIAQLANELSPDSVQESWEEDIKNLKENPGSIPAAVRSYVGNLRGNQITGFINEFVSHLQIEGNSFDFDSLKYQGESVELLKEWKKRIENYRGRNS